MADVKKATIVNAKGEKKVIVVGQPVPAGWQVGVTWKAPAAGAAPKPAPVGAAPTPAVPAPVSAAAPAKATIVNSKGEKKVINVGEAVPSGWQVGTTYKAPAAGTPAPVEGVAPSTPRQKQENAGNIYLGTMDAVAKAKKEGKEVIFDNGSYYVKPPASGKSDVQQRTDVGGAKTRSGIEAQGNTYLGTMAAVHTAVREGKNVFQVGKDYYFGNPKGVQSTTPKPTEVGIPEKYSMPTGPGTPSDQLSARKRIQDKIDSGEITDPRELIMGPGSTSPTAPNMKQTFDDLRAQYGMDESEEQLAAADDAIDALDNSYKAGVNETNTGMAPMTILEGRQKQLYDQYQQQRGTLQQQRDSVARRVDSKNATISTIMSLTQQDYANARQDYSDRFNQTLQVNQMLQQEANTEFEQWLALKQDARADTAEGRAQMQFEFNIQQAEKTEARSNLQVVYNSINDGNLDWNNLSADARKQIQTLEMQSGFPAGVIQALHNSDPNKNIVSTSARVDPSGMKYADVIMRDPKTGNMTVKTISLGKEYIAPNSADKTSETEFTQMASSLVSQALQNVVGGDGYVSPTDYKKARSQWLQQGFSSEDFDKRFSNYVNNSYKTYWSDYGLPQPKL